MPRHNISYTVLKTKHDSVDKIMWLWLFIQLYYTSMRVFIILTLILQIYTNEDNNYSCW